MAIVVGVACAARLAFLFDVRALGFFDSPVSDAQVYVERARGIVAGDWRGPADFVHAPLYAYFVAAVMRVAGPEPWWALRLVQAALGATACGLVAAAGRWWVGARAGTVAGLLLAVCPAAVFFDGLIQKTSLEIFLTAALLYSMAAYGRRGGLVRSVVIGVVLGLLTLTRQHALAVVPLVAAWLFTVGRATGEVRPARRELLGNKPNPYAWRSADHGHAFRAASEIGLRSPVGRYGWSPLAVSGSARSCSGVGRARGSSGSRGGGGSAGRA